MIQREDAIGTTTSHSLNPPAHPRHHDHPSIASVFILANCFLHVLRGGGTSDDFDQLASNDGLTGSVVEDLILVDHIAGVLGGVLYKIWVLAFWIEHIIYFPNKTRITHVHSLLTSGDLAGMTLRQGPEEGVGQGVLAQVGEELLVDLEGGVVGGVGEGLLGVGLDDGGLVAGGVDELIVDDLDVRVLRLELQHLVGDGLGVGKGRDVLADAGEGQDDVPAVRAAQLGPRLLADEREVGGLRAPAQLAPHEAGQAGVDAAAEPLVRAAHDVQGLLALGVQRLRLGVLEHLVVGLAVLPGRLHGALGAGQLRRGHHLHRLGDLLDVADRLEAAFDLSQGRVRGGIAVGGGDGSVGGGTRGLLVSYDALFFYIPNYRHPSVYELPHVKI